MTPGNTNKAAYLRTSRQFPGDPEQLAYQVNKAYIDIANAINFRVIGIFPTSQPASGGESWLINSNRRQQNQRQVYPFDDTNLTFDHSIDLNSLTNFVRIWGTFFDGTNWNNLPYVDVTSATNQIEIQVNATQIVVTKGAGAPPAIQNGLIVVEWIANP